MAVIEFPNRSACGDAARSARPARHSFAGRLAAAFTWLRARRRRRVNRERLRELCGNEDWLYRDLGISRADVEWAARLPLNVDAGRELERIRDRSLMGR